MPKRKINFYCYMKGKNFIWVLFQKLDESLVRIDKKRDLPLFLAEKWQFPGTILQKQTCGQAPL